MFHKTSQRQLFASLSQNNYTEKFHKIPRKKSPLVSIILKVAGLQILFRAPQDSSFLYFVYSLRWIYSTKYNQQLCLYLQSFLRYFSDQNVLDINEGRIEFWFSGTYERVTLFPYIWTRLHVVLTSSCIYTKKCWPIIITM